METQNQAQSQASQVGFPTPQPRQKKSINPIIIIIPVFLLILGGLAYFVFKGSSTEESGASPTPASQELSTVVTPSPVPSPSSSPVDKTSLSLRVLNGTGIPGEAGYLQGILKSLGYSKIDTGNADTTDATSTTVVYLSSVPQSLIDEMVTKLKTVYKSVTSRLASVKGAYDIEITTGPRTGSATQTSSPTSTPTAGQ